MPILVDKPEGTEGTVFDFEFHKLMGVEVSAIEDATGLYLADFVDAFYAGSWKVRHAVGWVLMKRTLPSLTLAQYVRGPSEIETRFNLSNARAYVEKYAGDPDEDDKAQIAKFFDEFGDAIYRKDDASPKVTGSE